MSLIALASLKASPGVTTAALALAATWPTHRDVVVAELDQSGGDLAARFGLKQAPGLVSFAAAARRESGASILLDHCQKLHGTLDVLVGPPSADHARSALNASMPALSHLRDLDGTDVLADVGRIDQMAAPWALLGDAELTLIVLRPVLSELQHLSAILEPIKATSRRVQLILVGSGHYRADEIRQTLDVEVAGQLAEDRSTADAINGGAASLAKFSRSALIRSARTLSQRLCELTNSQPAIDTNDTELSA